MEPNWYLSGCFFLLFCLPYMLPPMTNLITAASPQLVTAAGKNRGYEKYNCLPQETFSCQELNVCCLCSSSSTSAPLKRLWCCEASFPPFSTTPKQPLLCVQGFCCHSPAASSFGGAGCDRLLPPVCHPSKCEERQGTQSNAGVFFEQVC